MKLIQRGIAVVALSLGVAVLHGTPAAASPEEALPPGALKRFGTVRWRTGSRILCAVYSPDGKMLATGCGDDPVRLWDAKTGLVLRQIKEPWVFAIAFSSDGSLLATGSGFKTARVWNPITGDPVTPPLKGHEGTIKALAFSPDGKLLATAGTDRTVRLWSVPGGQPVGTLSGHQDEVNAVAFAPDGKTLASAGGDWTIRLWQIPGGQLLRRRDGGCAVAALAFGLDGKLLISAGDDAVIRLWDMDSGQVAKQWREHHAAIVSLVVSPDGKTLVSGDREECITIWDLTVYQDKNMSAARARIPRDLGDADALALAPDVRELVVGGSNNFLRRYRPVGDGRLWQPYPAEGPASGLTSIAQTAQGKLLAAGAAHGSAHVWDTETGKVARLEGGDTHGETQVAYAPDGKMVAVANAKDIRLFDPQTGKERQGVPLRVASLICMTFSPDASLLAVSTSDRGIGLWRVAGGMLAHQLASPGGIQVLAFSPDGKHLAGASAQKVIVWDITSGQQMLQFDSPGAAASLAFSADASSLAVGMYDSQILLRDLRPGIDEGARLRTLSGHGSAVLALAFSSDGRTLASGSYDRTVRLWETASGQTIQAWPGHLGAVSCLAYLPGGRVVVSGSADSSLLCWDVTGQSPGGKLASAKVGSGDMESLWRDLADSELPRAYRALWTLVAGADDVIPLLQNQKRVFLVDPEHIQKLLRDLNHNKFAVRERAYGELAKYGRWIEGVLDGARKDPPSEEVRRRVEKLLAAMQVPGALSLAQERLRARRLMMMLEQSATPAARELLEKLSRQAAEADLRAEAKASLERLAKRS